MKKFLLALFMVTISFSFVKAENYYVNDSGVEFSKKEYDFISNMFYEGYQNYVTLEDLEKIRSLKLYDSPIEKITSPEVMPLINIYEKGRTLTLAKSCSSNECLVAIDVVWAGSPAVKSYDVIGTLLDSTTIVSYGPAAVAGTNYSKTYYSPQKFSNGFGYSVLFPNTTNVKMTASYYAEKKGRVFASYQHAMEKISEANSKLYTLSIGGAGYVFDFYGAAKDVYDEAAGLTFALN